jgi:ABC-type branched-subunit amino acid transport system substrate-binding protein
MIRHLKLLSMLVLALVVVGCGRGDDDEQSGSNADSGSEVKTGPGVTARTIKLGALPDLTAVFGPLGKSMVQGMQLYWDGTNADGGVCGRQVEIDVRDTSYDPQKAVTLYREMSGEVLGLQILLGSPIVAALQDTIEQDNMYVSLSAWTSMVLPNPNIQITGATYDIESINGIDFLMREQGIKEGDKLGHIYFEGDLGENALAGAKYAASERGLEIVEQKITPADEDLSGQVAALKRAGVKAILMSTGPTQVASAAGVAASTGLDVPIMANGPGFTPQLLASPAADALVKNVYVVSAIAPYSLDSEGVQEIATAFERADPKGTPTQVGLVFGWAQSLVTHEALDAACEAGDLTREGVLKALHEMSGVDTGGVVAGPLDYTDPAQPPTRQVYVSKVSKDAPGGLEVVGEPFVSEQAENYQIGS